MSGVVTGSLCDKDVTGSLCDNLNLQKGTVHMAIANSTDGNTDIYNPHGNSQNTNSYNQALAYP